MIGIPPGYEHLASLIAVDLDHEIPCEAMKSRIGACVVQILQELAEMDPNPQPTGRYNALFFTLRDSKYVAALQGEARAALAVYSRAIASPPDKRLVGRPEEWITTRQGFPLKQVMPVEDLAFRLALRKLSPREKYMAARFVYMVVRPEVRYTWGRWLPALDMLHEERTKALRTKEHDLQSLCASITGGECDCVSSLVISERHRSWVMQTLHFDAVGGVALAASTMEQVQKRICKELRLEHEELDQDEPVSEDAV
jgi:hypothetical protein